MTPEETARNLKGPNNNGLCARTVSNRLREAGIRARRPYVGLPLTRDQHQRRMNWLQRNTWGVFYDPLEVCVVRRVPISVVPF